MSNENQSQKESGLPDTAKDSYSRNPLVMMIMAVAVAISLGMYFYTTKVNKKPTHPVEETYTIQGTETKSSALTQQESIPAASQPTPQVDPEVMQQQMALIKEQQQALQQRLSAPLMVVNEMQSNKTNESTQLSPLQSKDTNTQFMNEVSAENTEAATAITIGPLNQIIAEGSLVHAILESAINSDLPGHLRAIVNESVYSEDGTNVLIPRGSRLIGQYKSGMLQGQSRIFAVWTRVITPQGISIQLGSPGVDRLGVAGMNADDINHHFWERFGNASLLSLIGAGAANVGLSGADQDNPISSYREALANSFAQSADQSLQEDNQIKPTLMIHQGKPIIVFVARDLHFESINKKINPKINIF